MSHDQQSGTSGSGFISSGDDILRIARQHKERSKQYAESLIDLPFSCQVIPGKEFDQLRVINYWLKKTMEQCEKEFQSQPLGSRKTLKDIEMGIIPEVIRELDKLDIWTYKFSTGGPKRSPNDSIYYMTESGVSLRLKMAARYEEGERIMRLLKENVHFLGDAGLSEEPKLQYTTEEYATQEFYDQLEELKTGRDYHSTIRKYKRNGKIEIPRPTNITRSHVGNPVNHLIEKEQKNNKAKKWIGLFLTEEEASRLLGIPVESLKELPGNQKERMPFLIFDLFYVGKFTEAYGIIDESGIVFAPKFLDAVLDFASDVWDIMHSEEGSEAVKNKAEEQIKQLCGGDN